MVVETARGIELCEVWLENRTVEEAELVQPLRKVLRMATEEDLTVAKRNEERAKWMPLPYVRENCAHKLDMKLIEQSMRLMEVSCSFILRPTAA